MGMRNSILAIAASLALASCPLHGQNEVSMRMNEIKLDDAYVYAESAAGSRDEAYGMAIEELAAEVNGLRRGQGKEPTDMSALRREAKELGFNRSATSYRILLYVDYTSALSLPSAPALGIRLADESILGSKKSSGGETRADKPAPPKKDIHFVPSASSVGSRPTSSSSSGTTSQGASPAASGKMAGVARKLLYAGDLRELNEYMKECLSKGEVQQCGAPKTLGDIPSDAYRVVYDPNDYTITAILAPDGTNMSTMKTESLDDYAGHGVVWYR